MALHPIDERHALQIQAGTLGRKTGHEFEDRITAGINALPYPFSPTRPLNPVDRGDPAVLLLNCVASREGFRTVEHATAISTGALATSEAGKQWLHVNGSAISRCKSDLVLTLREASGRSVTVGVSSKQCGNAKPTNAQLFFTTARGFAALLQSHGIPVSPLAVENLRRFCGDAGHRPLDREDCSQRTSDPRRYFWEEQDAVARAEWEALFASQQDAITRLLLQKAYLNDPFVPDYLIHKTRRAPSWSQTEVAIYALDDLIQRSKAYQGYATRPYAVRKGSYRDPAGVLHLAPRFGIVQMQRGGQAQHPEQLQFNLEAGYFYKI